jgi:D-amino-acid dehydrogenase
LLGFARRCNEADHAKGRLALGALAGRCFELLDGMASDGVDVELQRAPLLVAAKDPRLAQKFLARLRPLSRLGFGVPTEILGQEEIRSLEPALTGAVRAGCLIEQHRVVEPQRLLAGLARRLAELDVQIQEGTEVRDVELGNGRLVSLQTSAGRYRFEQVVLAPGAWLGPLARLLEARLPVQAGKGYGFEVRPRRMPRYRYCC